MLAGYINKVSAVEEKLEIKTSTKILKDISPDTLKTAADMFLYLYSCPHVTDSYDYSISWFNQWLRFYEVLFKTTKPENIILAFNKMLNMKQNQRGSAQGRVSDIWKSTETFLSLKFEQIQSLLLGTVTLISDKSETVLRKYLISDISGKGHSNFDYVYSSLGHF